jgi:hypothetical protein
MMNPKARSRLVSFRVTSEELENLRVACLVQGARNVSDFARGAVLGLADARPQPAVQLLDRFSALELRLTEMQSTLQQSNDMVRVLLKNAVSREPEKSVAKGSQGC